MADYLFKLPKSIPEDRWLVHNQVYPVARRPGTRGSRIWLDEPGTPRPRLVTVDGRPSWALISESSEAMRDGRRAEAHA